MKLRSLLAVAACALTSAAIANPREGATFTNMPSDGGYAGSGVIWSNGPAYTVTKVRITGTCYDESDAYLSDVLIDIYPPGSTTPIIVQPFTGNVPFTSASTPAGGLVVTLPTPVTSTGEWSFFFDSAYNSIYCPDESWLNVTVRLEDASTNPTSSPTVYASAAPVIAGLSTTVLKAVVAPGTSPASTGITVHADLSLVGGATNVQLFDDGLGGGHGDRWSGDAEYSATISVPASLAAGTYPIPCSVTDAQGRSSAFSLPLRVQTVIDLGPLSLNPTPLFEFAALGDRDVKWYKFSIPACTQAAHTFLDSWISLGDNSGLALFNSTGGWVAEDAGGYSYSPYLPELSFGEQTPARPGGHNNFAGQKGELAAGTYYLAVYGNYNSVLVGGNNWSVNSLAPGLGAAYVNLFLEQSTTPTIQGNTTTIGNQSSALISAVVTPAMYPSPTSTTISASLASMGGGAVTLYDDATHGDATANDHVFSALISIPPGTAEGVYTIPLSLTDNLGNTAGGTDTLNIDLVGETILSAKAIDAPGAVTNIYGALTTSDADMFRIHICDPAHFSAAVTGGSLTDTQLFLFRPDGRGVAMNDDASATTALSLLNGPVVTSIPAGDYYLAISGYDKDPADSTGQALWLDTPFTGTRAPDGPGAAHALDHWDSNNTGTGPYVITLTGVSGSPCPPPGPTCGSADFNCDGDIGTDADIESFFACLAGNCPPLPCHSNADFNGDGDIGTDADIEAFFRVLAGGAC